MRRKTADQALQRSIVKPRQYSRWMLGVAVAVSFLPLGCLQDSKHRIESSGAQISPDLNPKERRAVVALLSVMAHKELENRILIDNEETDFAVFARQYDGYYKILDRGSTFTLVIDTDNETGVSYVFDRQTNQLSKTPKPLRHFGFFLRIEKADPLHYDKADFHVLFMMDMNFTLKHGIFGESVTYVGPQIIN